MSDPPQVRRDTALASRGAYVLILAVLFGITPEAAQGGLIVAGLVGVAMIVSGLRTKRR
jgi:hypothetical protein